MTMAQSGKEPLHLFVDTNVLLSFFAYTKDDLEQLRKLIGLIKSNSLVLYATSQVRDEFSRNREAKLEQSIGLFEKAQVLQSMPRFMEAYKEMAEYNKAAQ